MAHKGWNWALNLGSLYYLFLQVQLFFYVLGYICFFFPLPVNLIGKLGLWLSRKRVLSRIYYLLSTLDWVWERLRKLIRQQLSFRKLLGGRIRIKSGWIKNIGWRRWIIRERSQFLTHQLSNSDSPKLQQAVGAIPLTGIKSEKHHLGRDCHSTSHSPVTLTHPEHFPLSNPFPWKGRKPTMPCCDGLVWACLGNGGGRESRGRVLCHWRRREEREGALVSLRALINCLLALRNQYCSLSQLWKRLKSCWPN